MFFIFIRTFFPVGLFCSNFFKCRFYPKSGEEPWMQTKVLNEIEDRCVFQRKVFVERKRATIDNRTKGWSVADSNNLPVAVRSGLAIITSNFSKCLNWNLFRIRSTYGLEVCHSALWLLEMVNSVIFLSFKMCLIKHRLNAIHKCAARTVNFQYWLSYVLFLRTFSSVNFYYAYFITGFLPRSGKFQASCPC